MTPPETRRKPYQNSKGDWPEDDCPERGVYFMSCFACGHSFTGNKTRSVCKECYQSYMNGGGGRPRPVSTPLSDLKRGL